MTWIGGRRKTCGVRSLPHSLTSLTFLFAVVVNGENFNLITSY
jgi:hypothetical protein